MRADALRVLVVEDEAEIREFLVSQFIESGFLAQGLSSAKEFCWLSNLLIHK